MAITHHTVDTELKFTLATGERLSAGIRKELAGIHHAREMVAETLDNFRAALEKVANRKGVIEICCETQAGFREQYVRTFKLAQGKEPPSDEIVHDCSRVDAAFDALAAKRLEELSSMT